MQSQYPQLRITLNFDFVRGIKNIFKISIAWTLVIAQSCIEEIQPPSIEQTESLLVVDARISDRPINQEIILSRSFQLEEEPVFETGAEVFLEGSSGIRFNFLETQPGTYVSESALVINPSEGYSLNITLSDGSSFGSEQEFLPRKVEIGDIEFKREFNGFDEEGVGIYVKNSSTNGDPNFFRYEYEETYKIIAPNWDPFEFDVVRYEPCFPDPFVVEIKPRVEETKTCYASYSSRDIILASTEDQVENEIVKSIRFLSRDNYIISHRYSILVNQYSQSVDAFSFYESLDDFSSSDLVFSQVQPGLIDGNISAKNNSSVDVIGFFELSSFSSKRVYFNYEDLFPGEELPPYAVNCETVGNPRLWPEAYHCFAEGICDGNCNSPLIDQILAGTLVFAAEKEDDFLSPFFTLPSPCGDCTKLGSNVVPEFWSEE
nr:DUF4249 domain-containing protein [Croceivirga thetidis]